MKKTYERRKQVIYVHELDSAVTISAQPKSVTEEKGRFEHPSMEDVEITWDRLLYYSDENKLIENAIDEQLEDIQDWFIKNATVEEVTP